MISSSSRLIVIINCLLVAVCAPSFAAEEGDAKSADEIARELANPNNSLASLTFKNQFRTYEGDLPKAGDQSNYMLLFQPVFPFSLEPTESGAKANLFVRPAFPLLVDQPVPEFTGGGIEYDEVSALGDIVFDVGYGVTEKSGLLWALGVVGTLPTATDDAVGGDQWRLGPELLMAKFEKWGLYGFFPSHQWDIAGDNDVSYSMSQLQLFLRYLPGGGWNVGTSPIMTYDWKNEQATVPLSFSAGKTVKWGSTPVKLEVELNHYIEHADAFGPEWMLSINITPVVPNVFENWLKGS